MKDIISLDINLVFWSGDHNLNLLNEGFQNIKSILEQKRDKLLRNDKIAW